jgi:hypothetical protein
MKDLSLRIGTTVTYPDGTRGKIVAATHGVDGAMLYEIKPEIIKFTDTERLDWIENGGWCALSLNATYWEAACENQAPFSGGTMREAIDAAMRAEHGL